MLYFTFADPYLIYSTVVLLTALSIYLIFNKKEFLKKHKNTIYLVVSVLLIWTQIARYLVVYLKGDFDIYDNLPFFICRLSVLVLLYFTLTKDRRVMSFLFYWGATGLTGILYPNGPISNIPNLTETFYIDHFLLAVSPFFLVAIEGYKPIRNDLLKITGVMFLILVMFIPINHWLGSDYFYITDQSIFGVLVPNAPKLLFITVHTLAAFLFFSVYYKKFKNYHN